MTQQAGKDAGAMMGQGLIETRSRGWSRMHRYGALRGAGSTVTRWPREKLTSSAASWGRHHWGINILGSIGGLEDGTAGGAGRSGVWYRRVGTDGQGPRA